MASLPSSVVGLLEFAVFSEGELDYRYNIGRFEPPVEEEGATSVSFSIIVVGFSGDNKVLVAFPQRAWHRRAQHRLLAPQTLTKALCLQVGFCDDPDNRLQATLGGYSKIWLGWLNPAAFETEGEVDHPFLVFDSEEACFPFAEALQAAAVEKFGLGCGRCWRRQADGFGIRAWGIEIRPASSAGTCGAGLRGRRGIWLSFRGSCSCCCFNYSTFASEKDGRNPSRIGSISKSSSFSKTCHAQECPTLSRAGSWNSCRSTPIGSASRAPGNYEPFDAVKAGEAWGFSAQQADGYLSGRRRFRDDDAVLEELVADDDEDGAVDSTSGLDPVGKALVQLTTTVKNLSPSRRRTASRTCWTLHQANRWEV